MSMPGPPMVKNAIVVPRHRIIGADRKPDTGIRGTRLSLARIIETAHARLDDNGINAESNRDWIAY